MGYTTEFEGKFNLDKPLSNKHYEYLKAFSNNRHEIRNADLLVGIPDPVREAVNLPLGEQGCYFIGNQEFFGQNNHTDTIIGYMSARNMVNVVPGYWCQWEPTEDKMHIEWNGAEKFYDYIKWLKFIIKHFIEPWGYVLNGSVEWQGEDETDTGKIKVFDNVVSTLDFLK